MQDELSKKKNYLLWSLTYLFSYIFFLYIISCISYFGEKHLDILVLIIIPTFVFIQSFMSSKIEHAFQRLILLVISLTIAGLADNIKPSSVAYAVLFYFVIYAVIVLLSRLIATLSFKYLLKRVILTHIPDEVWGRLYYVWIIIPILALAVAIATRPILIANHSILSEPSETFPEGLRIYSFPPSIIRQTNIAVWIGFLLYLITSIFAHTRWEFLKQQTENIWKRKRS